MHLEYVLWDMRRTMQVHLDIHRLFVVVVYRIYNSVYFLLLCKCHDQSTLMYQKIHMNPGIDHQHILLMLELMM